MGTTLNITCIEYRRKTCIPFRSFDAAAPEFAANAEYDADLSIADSNLQPPENRPRLAIAVTLSSSRWAHWRPLLSHL